MNHPHYLMNLLKPRSIAVFGASEQPDAVGMVLLRNILEGDFQGPVYPINPKYDSVQGIKAYPAMAILGKSVDLAVIATPAATIPGIMEDLGQHGTRAAIVLSAGFREVGEHGKRLEEQVLAKARKFGIRFLGPNCLGMVRPDISLNASVSKGSAERGHVALVSQSGALCTAILDWADTNGVGLSSVISTGISADLDFGEILDFLISDPQTKSILLYIEGIRDARRFMSGLRAAARVKPVIAMKTGRHMEGSRAVLSHTGALVGADNVFDAAFSRAGVVRVLNFANLFGAAKTLSSGLRTRGNRLAIVTNGGGTGVMAADRLADKGLPVIELSKPAIEALNRTLPRAWSHQNPVDIMGDATPERFREAVSICLDDDNVDAVLAILTPQAMSQPEAVAHEMIALAKRHGKPLLTCWMGETQVASSRQLFSRHNIPSYRTPEAGVDAFHLMAAYQRNQQLLLQVPEPMTKGARPDLEGARIIVDQALIEQRTLLNEIESKALLAAFHIPIAKSMRARSANEALLFAEELGLPVLMKIDALTSTPDSALGELRLTVTNAHDLHSGYDDLLTRAKRAYPTACIDKVIIEEICQRAHGRELTIQVLREPVFGPTISVCVGGAASEIVGCRAVALPPLNPYLVQHLLRSTRAHRLLSAFQNLPLAKVEALEDMLLRISEMVCALPHLKEMELDPVIVDAKGAVAVDARIVVEHRAPSEEAYAHMAIHPYPDELLSTWKTKDGKDITIRPIRPEDAIIENQFVHGLSARSKYFRFMYALQDLTPAMLSRFTQIDYDREMALIAVTNTDRKEKQIGVARYTINPDGESCEFAIVVSDKWQGKGIATRLMNCLIDTACRKRLRVMEGDVLRENQNMLALMRRLGFEVHQHPDDHEVMSVSKFL